MRRLGGTMLLGARTVAHVEGPTSVVLGHAASTTRPAVTRVWGVRVEPDHETLRLLAPDDDVRALDPGAAIAATFASCVDYRSVQLKGTVVTVEAVGPDDRELVDEYTRAFVAVNLPIGVSEGMIRGMRPRSLAAVRMRVEAAYDQTPRPGAGNVVEALA